MKETPETAALAARIEELEREIERQRDIHAIHDVLWRYARALDWLDDALLATVFYDDAEIDYGFFRGNGRDFRSELMKLEHTVGRRWHIAIQTKVQLDGDSAEVESYQFSVSTLPGETSTPADLLHAYGYYVDRMLRRGGKWGIIRRKHLLLGTTLAREVPMDGALATLNAIGMTSPGHVDYRQLSRAASLDPP